jgi:cell division protein FtsI/penicillin-binding protein 2
MHRRRLVLMAVFFAVFGVVLSLRLVQWQIIEHDQATDRADRMHSRRAVIEPQRGAIYDRNGRLLAVSLNDQEVIGDPIHFQKQMTQPQQEAAVAAAAPILGIPADDLRRILSTGESHYAPLRSTISITASKQLLESPAYPAIAVFPKMKRFYPAHALLAHAIGFTNSDGEGIGVEGYYSQYLKGVPGQRLVEGPVYGKGMGRMPVIVEAQNGTDITLTLDINIQYIAERALENALAAEKTITGVVIIMDPKTGEILAMAGRPTFDPNDYSAVAQSVWKNPAIMDPWEPGSIFKILTFAAGVDANKISAATTFVDRSPWKYFGITINNRDNKSYGTITPTQALIYSSNPAAVQVANTLSTTTFYTYMTSAFGIGAKTGVDLAGEVVGSIRLPVDAYWHISDLATHSYGQGLSVTPIEMTAAVAAIANKGIMMRPYIVARIPGAGDLAGGPGPLRRSVKPETAATLTDWLVQTVEKGVKEARVPGYKLAGKTGTALIPPPAGNYDLDDTIASFIGYGPAEDPRFVILVRIDRPQVHQTGAEVAAPVFKNIAQWLLTYLKIPPSDLRAQRP